MVVEVKMPNFGISITEGTIERWLKSEGDSVVRGDLLVSIITEKVNVEIPAETSGVLLKILHPAGSVVKIEETIAIIDSSPSPSPSPDRPSSSLKERGDLKVSPLALRIAEEHGVDMGEVVAAFPGKKIGKQEIFAFLERKKGKISKEEEKPSPVSSEEEVKPLSGPLRAMAEHMALSARTAARVTTMAEVDMTEMVRLRHALKDPFQKSHGLSLTFVPFVMKAIGEGVREFPILNASLRDKGIIMHPSVNVGLAVDAGDRLLVPVVRDVAHKGIGELSREVNFLSTKAREGNLSLQDIQGGTISLTNAGVYGALLATPIIHQPQSAILWMGKVTETPVVRDGQIVIRSIMYLCLSYDHRIIMGAQAVRFLQFVKKALENPHSLLTIS